ncbi:FtsQ-type POTRA domain-containing protein [Nocardioides guangzhouensis]|uniref:Cell division protein FtsQ n=1 Tax=Nocardioides guangzhouensis TaxID=2497878 RepID=A0A4Q4Z6A6_9ACTN|nr:FtsQ-type POTRA domain-containing protein [Nocardioides guangzhouensis]RYP83337.1 FtsQ-type POTRA domain-containing protein [Nocardioides guangzhouensis]
MIDLRTGEEHEAEVSESSRRRFARRQWARRWLAWRLVVAVLLVLALVAGVVWLFFFSSTLAVKGVEVQGTAQLTEQQVRAAAAVPTGEPLARADLAGIRDRVEDLPQVASVDVSRQWPDRILLRVTERQAVAVVEVDGRLRGMDDGGVVFRDYARRPRVLPLVKVPAGTGEEALAEGAEVVGALPFRLARKVAYVEVASVDRITLHLRDGRTVMWGSAEQSDEKAVVLDALLQRPGRELDVSVPGQPTSRG